MRPKTLYEKIWEKHLVIDGEDNPSILFIDLHLVIDTSSPQAFDALRSANRQVRRKDLTIATVDHSVPTINRDLPIKDNLARQQVEALSRNCKEFGIKLFDLFSPQQGIVHVIAPELGLTLPGQTIVCGDSHTSTHGAFGALAFGIGTSEVEHVLATQCLYQRKSKTLAINVENTLPFGTTAKDLVLYIIGQLGTGFANGYIIEYRGQAIEALSMEERMTLCNMSIEMGARAGLVAPDQKTFDYLKDSMYGPKGELWNEAIQEWKSLYTDEGAIFDKSLVFDAQEVAPQVTWGINPSMTVSIGESVPSPLQFEGEERRIVERALKYMDLTPHTRMQDIAIDVVFIGSCTNSRIEDLRSAAQIVQNKHKHPSVLAIVVPGSQKIKQQAEEEGLHRIFIDAGFEWREAGCSMCIGMNGDEVAPGKRSASTSNRNFEGRQGKGARTHLVSPAMAAAAAIEGHFVDIRQFIAEQDGGCVNGSLSNA